MVRHREIRGIEDGGRYRSQAEGRRGDGERKRPTSNPNGPPSGDPKDRRWGKVPLAGRRPKRGRGKENRQPQPWNSLNHQRCPCKESHKDRRNQAESKPCAEPLTSRLGFSSPYPTSVPLRSTPERYLPPFPLTSSTPNGGPLTKANRMVPHREIRRIEHGGPCLTTFSELQRRGRPSGPVLPQ